MAITFKPNHRRVDDALTDVLSTEYKTNNLYNKAIDEPSMFGSITNLVFGRN